MENDYRVQESPKVHVRIVNKNVSSTSGKAKPSAPKRPPMSRYSSMTESWQRKMNEKPKKLEAKSKSFQNVLFHESSIIQEDIAQGYTTQYKLEDRIEYPETPSSPKSLIKTPMNARYRRNMQKYKLEYQYVMGDMRREISSSKSFSNEPLEERTNRPVIDHKNIVYLTIPALPSVKATPLGTSNQLKKPWPHIHSNKGEEPHNQVMAFSNHNPLLFQMMKRPNLPTKAQLFNKNRYHSTYQEKPHEQSTRQQNMVSQSYRNYNTSSTRERKEWDKRPRSATSARSALNPQHSVMEYVSRNERNLEQRNLVQSFLREASPTTFYRFPGHRLSPDEFPTGVVHTPEYPLPGNTFMEVTGRETRLETPKAVLSNFSVDRRITGTTGRAKTIRVATSPANQISSWISTSDSVELTPDHFLMNRAVDSSELWT